MGKEITLIKGAAEVILQYCNYYYDTDGKEKKLLSKKRIDDVINSYSSRGIRVIVMAIGYEEISDNNFNNLILLGIILIKDEVRKDAKNALDLIKKAQINTIMVTGDNIKTAIGIAKEVELLESDRILF
jgi:P-type E1-E2 ATPase